MLKLLLSNESGQILNPLPARDYPEGFGLSIGTEKRMNPHKWVRQDPGRVLELIRRFGVVVLENTSRVRPSQELYFNRPPNLYHPFHVDGPNEHLPPWFVSHLFMNPNARDPDPTFFVPTHEYAAQLRMYSPTFEKIKKDYDIVGYLNWTFQKDVPEEDKARVSKKFAYWFSLEPV